MMMFETDKARNAEFAEVVLCRDCKHWVTVFNADKAENGLCYGFKSTTFVTPKEGYCFKGERADDDGN